MERDFLNPCRRRRKQCCKDLGGKCVRRAGCRTCRCKQDRIYSNTSKLCVRRQPTTQPHVMSNGSTTIDFNTPEGRPRPTQTSRSSYITSGTKSKSMPEPTPTSRRQKNQSARETTATTGHAGNDPKFWAKFGDKAAQRLGVADFENFEYLRCINKEMHFEIVFGNRRISFISKHFTQTNNKQII